MKGSKKWTPVWDGLWTKEHSARMGKAYSLFGFLLSRSNKKGIVKITYEQIEEATQIPVRTLKSWKSRLENEGYISTIDKGTLIYTIINYRSIHDPESYINTRGKKLPHRRGNVAQEVAPPLQEVAPPLQEVAPLTAITPGKTNGSPPLKKGLKDNKNIYSLFNFWNSKKIIKHRVFGDYEDVIKASLMNYSREEIIQAIENYSEVLNGDEYYYSVRLTLYQFLIKRNGIDRFLDRQACLKEFLINKKANKYKTQGEMNAAGTGKVVT